MLFWVAAVFVVAAVAAAVVVVFVGVVVVFLVVVVAVVVVVVVVVVVLKTLRRTNEISRFTCQVLTESTVVCSMCVRWLNKSMCMRACTC